VDLLLSELSAGFGSLDELGRVLIRLTAAMALGAVIGLQREFVGAAAGLRTHMLVALAATIFVLVPPRAGMSAEDLSRVIQGVATGIGFIGAGAILKLTTEREIHGLTTAASIWMTTAVGVAVGLGRLGIAAVSVALAWVILSVLGRIERQLAPDAGPGPASARVSAAAQEARGRAEVGDEPAPRRAVLLRRDP
jgi:putative Mg2+ transporter-C (MgtC) family protein